MSGQPRLDDADDRPWERPGGVRRDLEPHRGQDLLAFGFLSFGLTIFTFFFVPLGLLALPAGATLGLLALPAGVVVWRLARRDLAAIRAGCMDPAGEDWLRVACGMGAFAVVGTLWSWAMAAMWFSRYGY